MGVAAARSKTVDELRAALETARQAPGTTVIVCPTDPDRPLLGSGAFWDLGVPEVAASAATTEVTHDHLDRRRVRQRTY
jgi:3D-(3,5/4)-trihydroxycyclohexane-1,2-dione acylhydrolase (decyclizing)